MQRRKKGQEDSNHGPVGATHSAGAQWWLAVSHEGTLASQLLGVARCVGSARAAALGLQEAESSGSAFFILPGIQLGMPGQAHAVISPALPCPALLFSLSHSLFLPRGPGTLRHPVFQQHLWVWTLAFLSAQSICFLPAV